MEMKGDACAAILVILIWALAMGSSEGGRRSRTLGTLPTDEAPSQKINKKMAFIYLSPKKQKHARVLYHMVFASNKESSSSSEEKQGSKASPPPSTKKQSPPPSSKKKSPSSGGSEDKKTLAKEHEDIQKKLIIAVVATAASTFTLVALLFCCCFRCRRNRSDPKHGRRHDRPLLDVSSSGSSQQSLNLGNSSGNNFSTNNVKNSTYGSTLSTKRDSSSNEAQSMDANGGGLPPPPGKPAPPPPKPPPTPPPGPRPPLPPKACPPVPPKSKPIPPAPNRKKKSASGDGDEPSDDFEASKAKLKPFFWDKVLANPGHSMVWHEISGGSFQFNEEMIESLFGYTPAANNGKDRKKDSSEPAIQYIKIIDPRKAQNLSILLRALNVTTTEVVDALHEGNELPVELLSTLMKMAPTQEEELKLRLYTGDLALLGPAERFLKVLVEIPFAFKRMESLLFMCSMEEEVSGIKESFKNLEVACDKLKSSRLFLKLLEAVLKTGNRMNDGTYRGDASAFKLDTLLKLSDVKGTDGKTTLLHFVVQEIIRTEGIKAVRSLKTSQSISSLKSEDLVEDPNQDVEDNYYQLGLQVVSGLSSELEDVKKAAVIDANDITSTVTKLNTSLKKVKDFLKNDIENSGEQSKFGDVLSGFINQTENDIKFLLEEEKRIMALVKSTGDYFHGHSGKDEGLRLFAIVRDFLIMVDKVSKEVKEARMKQKKHPKKDKDTTSSMPPSPDNKQRFSSDNGQHFNDMRARLFPAIQDRRADSSSSDDE